MAGEELQSSGEGANLCSVVIVIISLLLWLTRSDPHVARGGQRLSPRRGCLSPSFVSSRSLLKLMQARFAIIMI